MSQYTITPATTVDVVIGLYGHVVAITNSCIVILGMGSGIIEFFELCNRDGYHLVCEWLLKGI